MNVKLILLCRKIIAYPERPLSCKNAQQIGLTSHSLLQGQLLMSQKTEQISFYKIDRN
jgi:hypothetical protein